MVQSSLLKKGFFMSEEIIIDIDNLRARKIIQKQDNNNQIKNHFYIDQYAEKIQDLIESRINEFQYQNNRVLDYFQYRMHDSILIYGTRGNGKTTIMMNLNEILKGDFAVKKIKIMGIIDPTLLEEDEDFLLVILKNLYREVLEEREANFNSEHDNDRHKFETQLEKILEQIQGTRLGINKIEIFEKFYGNKSGISLAIAIHELFHTITKIFNVHAIILPIDDIDMNMTQGYKITETIRKYLSSPYVIPIVSFNLKQMNAIAKKKKYEAFGLDIKEANKGDYKDLSFLLSLASDYLASIFPPNRRVFLQSILPILQQKLSLKENPKRIYLKSEKLKVLKALIYFKDSHNISEYKIDIIILLRFFLESVYEKTLKSNYLNDKNNISDYLTNRSIRDFFNDMSALIRSFSIIGTKDNKDNTKYIIYSKQSLLLSRFSPENQNLFINKEQALTSLWDDFLEIAKKNIQNSSKNYHDIQNNWADMITSVTHEDYPELVNKKTYRRLWLQRYYNPKPIKITIDEEDKENNFFHFKIAKKTSVSGFLELAMRSFIPMFLFESIISHHKNINYSMYDIMELRNFSTDTLLQVAYHISTMELLLKKHNYNDENLRKKAKLFASINVNYRKDEIYEPYYNIPYLFKLKNQDLFFDVHKKESNQIYFFSIFKSIALFIESLKIIEEEYPNNSEDIKIESLNIRTRDNFRRLFEKYAVNLPCEHKDSYVKNFIKQIFDNKHLQKLLSIQEFTLENSELGIIECMRFSKRIIRFFYEIRSNINLEDNFSSLNFEINRWECNPKNRRNPCKIVNEEVEQKDNMLYCKGEGTLSTYFHFPLSAYLSGFSQSLLVSLINTQQDYKDFIIYTRTSIHGANLKILKKQKDGSYKLSKKSNLFLSNINYLLPKNKKLFPQLSSISDETYLLKHEKESTNKEHILKFYNSFLGIKYFYHLMKNYNDIEPTEKCTFLKTILKK